MLRVIVLNPTCSCEVSGFEEDFVGMREGEGFRCTRVGDSDGGRCGGDCGGGDGVLELFSSTGVDRVCECGFRVATEPDFGVLEKVTP